jgi:hypothetical protein
MADEARDWAGLSAAAAEGSGSPVQRLACTQKLSPRANATCCGDPEPTQAPTVAADNEEAHVPAGSMQLGRAALLGGLALRPVLFGGGASAINRRLEGAAATAPPPPILVGQQVGCAGRAALGAARGVTAKVKRAAGATLVPAHVPARVPATGPPAGPRL